MFGMSMTEIIIIAVVALLIFGPGELPKMARTVGKTLRELRRAGDDLRDTFEREVMEEPARPKGPPPNAVSSVRTGALPPAVNGPGPTPPDAASLVPAPPVATIIGANAPPAAPADAPTTTTPTDATAAASGPEQKPGA